MREQDEYWNNEVAEILEIGESTLRKWCIALEENGYTFTKGAMDSRVFTNSDLAALALFKQLAKAKKHTREQAASVVARKFAPKGENGVNNPVPIESKIAEILKKLHDQEEFNKSLLEELNKQGKLIEEISRRLEK